MPDSALTKPCATPSSCLSHAGATAESARRLRNPSSPRRGLEATNTATDGRSSGRPSQRVSAGLSGRRRSPLRRRRAPRRRTNVPRRARLATSATATLALRCRRRVGQLRQQRRLLAAGAGGARDCCARRGSGPPRQGPPEAAGQGAASSRPPAALAAVRRRRPPGARAPRCQSPPRQRRASLAHQRAPPLSRQAEVASVEKKVGPQRAGKVLFVLYLP